MRRMFLARAVISKIDKDLGHMRGMVATPRIFCSGYQHRVKVSSSQVNGHCVDPDRNSFCRVWLKGFKQSFLKHPVAV